MSFFSACIYLNSEGLFVPMQFLKCFKDFVMICTMILWQSYASWTADSVGEKHDALQFDPMVMVSAPALLPKQGCSSSKQKARFTDRVRKTCPCNNYLLFHFFNTISVPYTCAFEYSNVGNELLITSKPYTNCFQIQLR